MAKGLLCQETSKAEEEQPLFSQFWQGALLALFASSRNLAAVIGSWIRIGFDFDPGMSNSWPTTCSQRHRLLHSSCASLLSQRACFRYCGSDWPMSQPFSEAATQGFCWQVDLLASRPSSSCQFPGHSWVERCPGAAHGCASVFSLGLHGSRKRRLASPAEAGRAPVARAQLGCRNQALERSLIAVLRRICLGGLRWLPLA